MDFCLFICCLFIVYSLFIFLIICLFLWLFGCLFEYYLVFTSPPFARCVQYPYGRRIHPPSTGTDKGHTEQFVIFWRKVKKKWRRKSSTWTEIKLAEVSSGCCSAMCFIALLLLFSLNWQLLQLWTAFMCLNRTWLPTPSLLATSVPQKVQALSFSGRWKERWTWASSNGAILARQPELWL